MKIAILGIGEVGTTLAEDLIAVNVHVSGWDPNPRNRPIGLHFAENNAAAVKDVDLILSANLATVSLDIAREVLPCLKAGQIYADMNTSSPQIKQAINQVLAESPVRFADVAIMAPIAPKRIATPLIAGDGATQFAKLFSQFNSSIIAINESAGYAAKLKLVRSIFYKGLAAVVMENTGGSAETRP